MEPRQEFWVILCKRRGYAKHADVWLAVSAKCIMYSQILVARSVATSAVTHRSSSPQYIKDFMHEYMLAKEMISLSG